MSVQFRDGDPDAVRAIYREYGRLVFAVAYRVLGDRGLAEEATQQTFLKAWRAATSFDTDRELGPWLARSRGGRRSTCPGARPCAPPTRSNRSRRATRADHARSGGGDIRRVGGARGRGWAAR